MIEKLPENEGLFPKVLARKINEVIEGANKVEAKLLELEGAKDRNKYDTSRRSKNKAG